MTISSVTSGFRATGIFPFDKDTLPVEAFMPSLPTHRLEALNEEIDSDYAVHDCLPLETLRQMLNTAENIVKQDVFRADQSPESFDDSSQLCSSISQNQKPKPYTIEEKWDRVSCYTEYVPDMRTCFECEYWIHEECLGLTADDADEKFLCPNCMPYNLRSSFADVDDEEIRRPAGEASEVS
ncbi:hypothetical protein Trydic_g14137 [Trypoxylus dichotomus]